MENSNGPGGFRDIFRKQKLYPILDLSFLEKWELNPYSILELWLARGLRYYQLRAKGMPERGYEDMARQLKSDFPSLEIIANDFLNAALYNTDLFSGIHLGQEDLGELNSAQYSLLKEKLENHEPEQQFLAGFSTHSLSQLRQALPSEQSEGLNWSYVALGPIFGTDSKPTGLDPVLSQEEREAAFSWYGLERKRVLEQAPAGVIWPELVIIGGLDGELLCKIPGPNFLNQNDYFPHVASIGACMFEEKLNNLYNQIHLFST